MLELVLIIMRNVFLLELVVIATCSVLLSDVV